jgi:hypothetical protein
MNEERKKLEEKVNSVEYRWRVEISEKLVMRMTYLLFIYLSIYTRIEAVYVDHPIFKFLAYTVNNFHSLTAYIFKLYWRVHSFIYKGY